METITETNKAPQGIGGWLIIVLIGLAVTPFRSFYIFFKDLFPVIKSEIFSNNPALQGMVNGEITVNIIYVAFSIFLFILMFKKHKLFPRLIIIYFLSNLFFVALDMIVGSQIPIIQQHGINKSSIIELFRSFIGSAIWVPYFIFSKRVKNTFVNPIQPSDSKTLDIFVFISIAYWFVSDLANFIIHKLVVHWYESPAKYFQICTNILFVIIPILIALSIRNKGLKIVAIILAAFLSIYLLYSNINWLVSEIK